MRRDPRQQDARTNPGASSAELGVHLRGNFTPLERFTHAMRAFGIESVASGKGLRFDCPHGHRSRRTLAAAESAGGTLLIKCQAGCETPAVLETLGLSLADLFPQRIPDYTPEGRREAKAAMRMAAWTAALDTLAFEARVVWIAGGDVIRRNLSEADHDRVRVALELIDRARQVLSAR
jgi:hypothetical protein